LRYGIAAWIAGGSLVLFFSALSQLFVIGLAVAILVCAIACKLSSYHRLLGISLLFLLGCAWSTWFVYERLNTELAAQYEGIDLWAEGYVDALPQGDIRGVRFSFVIDRYLNAELNSLPLPRKVYLSWQAPWRTQQAIPEIKPGQVWQLQIRLKRPHGNLNLHSFDFERWLFQHGYRASGSVRSGELLIEKSAILPWSFFTMVEQQRWSLRDKIRRLVPADAPYRGVLIALVLGDQNAIPQADWKVFNATGIGHLISISGLHVTMIAGMGAALAGLLWRRGALPLLCPIPKVAGLAGFLTAFAYAWLAGFQIPAQRTMYMVGVVAVALWSGRTPRLFDIWWWALALVFLIDPMAPYTPGFWLSFGAVAAILYSMGESAGLLGIPTGKELESSWCKRTIIALREACRVQAVVTITLIPFTLYWFYQTSLVSPLANALAIPLISYVVTPLALSGAFLPEWLAKPCLILAHSCMEWLGHGLTWLASLSWAVARSHQPAIWACALSLLGITLAIRPGQIHLRWRSRCFGLILCTTLFWPNSVGLIPGEFRASVFDIGQGTAVLIETATRRLLYDAGPIHGKNNDAGEQMLLPYFRGEGITVIDRLVISHSDSDHVGGITSLLKGLNIKSFIGSLPLHNPALKKIRAANIFSLPCRYGQYWQWDEVEFRIWHPSEITTFGASEYRGKPNEMSCVLEVRNARTSFWLTGDIEKQAEAAIVSRFKQPEFVGFDLGTLANRALIFMAPHHGSKTSSSLELLRLLSPDAAFAQNGYRNRYGHPHPLVSARYQVLGIPLTNTPSTGMQTWVSRRTKLEIDWMRHKVRRLWHEQAPN
jgi:competence protein ComEC